jgi:hypothetical protein
MGLGYLLATLSSRIVQIASSRKVSQKVEGGSHETRCQTWCGVGQVSWEIRKSYAALTQVASCDHVQTIGGREAHCKQDIAAPAPTPL